MHTIDSIHRAVCIALLILCALFAAGAIGMLYFAAPAWHNDIIAAMLAVWSAVCGIVLLAGWLQD